MAAQAQQTQPGKDASPGGEIVAYVGAYTDRGKGIHLFHVDRATGTLNFTGVGNPSKIEFLAL
jgi:hypothetical protein